MPDNLPLLYELEVTISEPVDNSYPVQSILMEHGPYPPEPKRKGNKIVFPARCVVYESDVVRVPAEVLNAAMLPPGFNSRFVHFPTSGESLTGLLERVRAHMSVLTRAIFQPPADDLLTRLLSQATSFNPYSEQPPAFCRLTLVLESPALSHVPWELMLWETGAGEEYLRERCLIMRRSRDESGEKSGSFDLPVNVALGTETALVSPDEVNNWGPYLFDQFTADARELGGIKWDELDGGIKPGEALHVMFDSIEPESMLRLENRVRSIGQATRERGGWSVPPRLLVLHDVSANLPPYINAHLVQSALANGADAVLLAAMESGELSTGKFFQIFYRKLMHNWPLDQCLWAAQAAAAAQSTQVDCVFGARKGGEYGLLLTRAVLEAAQPKAASIEEKSWRLRPEARRGGGAKEIFRKASVKRSSRVASDIEGSLRKTVEDAKETAFREAYERTRGITFDRESHGVSEVLNARRTVDSVMLEAAEKMKDGEKALDMLARAKPEAVQQAMVRLTNLWITEKTWDDQLRIITPHDYLVSRRPYNLHLQIGPRREGALVAERFNEESLKKVFEKVEEVLLDVMFFSTDTDFKLEGDALLVPQHDEKSTITEPIEVDGGVEMQTSIHARWGARATLRLPRYGPSNELNIKITPRDHGLRRIRTCIYYRNVLLQSVLLEAEVAEEGTEQAAAGAVSEETIITGRVTDYIATVDFALLDELPQPSLNIFTNYDPSGTHWVGAFSSGDTSEFTLQSGGMHTFEDALLNTRSANIRDVLIKIEGEKKSYKLNAPLPLSEDELKRREGYLRDLALSGFNLFHPLFYIGDGDSDNAQRLKTFRDTIKDSHIISIARCGPNSATLPWAALYSNPLDSDKESEISLCEVFKKQLADNKWSQGQLVEKHDLLDDPKACRSQAECPLNDEAKRKLTVCPFGFWGFLHQVEQPLQQVKPTPVDEVPAELKNTDFGQTSFLVHPGANSVKVAIGSYPGIPEVKDHDTEIKSLNKIVPMDVDYQDDRDQVMTLLKKGGQHVYYFYCHGDVDDKAKVFKLKLGPSVKPGYIASSHLLPDEIQWQTPKPLFIMNGCETMAVTPDVTHGFLSTLKALGASGVIGTEIKVWTQLARPFGLQLLTHLLNGMSVGEAFLEARKHLLRQYNPLGLVYSYYSPATLHLHDPLDCKWCASHMNRRT